MRTIMVVVDVLIMVLAVVNRGGVELQSTGIL